MLPFMNRTTLLLWITLLIFSRVPSSNSGPPVLEKSLGSLVFSNLQEPNLPEGKFNENASVHMKHTKKSERSANKLVIVQSD